MTLGAYGPITVGMDEQAAVAADSLKVERTPYCSLPGVAVGTLYSMPAATDPRIEVVTDAGTHSGAGQEARSHSTTPTAASTPSRTSP